MNEWIVYRTLVATFIRMNARGRNGRTAYGRAVAFLITYGISAAYLGISLAAYYDPTSYVYLSTAVTMYIVGFTVMSTYSLILLDSGDGRLLAAYPIHSQTLFLARATNLTLFVVLTVAPFTLPLTIIHFITERSVLSSAAYLVVQVAAAFWATGIFAVIYNLLMVASRRFTHVMSIAQILLIFALLFFYQSLPGITGHHTAFTQFLMQRWVQLTPPMWFTALHHALAGVERIVPVASQVVLLVGTSAALLLALRTRWMLLPADSSGSTRNAPGSTRNPRGSLLHRWLAERSPATAAGVSLFGALSMRERTVRFQILPVVMMSIAVALYGVLTGELNTPFRNGILSWDARLHIPILVFYLSSVRHVEHVALRAVEPTSVWILELQGRATRDAYADGVARSIFWRILLPQLLLILGVFMLCMDPVDAVAQVLFLLVFGGLQSAVLGIRTRVSPFTRIENTFATMQRFAQFLVVIPFVTLALLLHLGSRSSIGEYFTMLFVVALLTLALQYFRRLLRWNYNRRQRHSVLATAAIALALLLPSCASQRAPEGGPPDTEPPAVFETQPVAGATRVSGNRVLLRFSEYVDRTSFANALHISPLQPTMPEIVWRGTDVELQFTEPFADDQTYVISVGSSVRDLNAGNQMATSFILAFSTGDSVDAGTLRGRVFDAKPAGVSIFAWRLDTRLADTLNLSRTRPDYVVQTGADGSFGFAHLVQAPYRVLAVRDKQSNALYDVQTDEFGTTQVDPIPVRDSTRMDLRFQLSMEDTTAPYTQQLVADAATRLTIVLSETPVRDLRPDDLLLKDSASGIPVGVLAVLPVSGKRGTFTVHTASALDSVRYLLRADSVSDAAGNGWRAEASVVSLTGSRTPDTTRLDLLVLDPPNKAMAVDASLPIVVQFSHPMRGVPTLTLADSAGTVIPISIERIDAATFHAQGPVPGGKRLNLCIDLATCIDSLRGVRMGDSLRCVSFTTSSDDDYGSVTGVVEGIDSTREHAVVRVRSTAPQTKLRTTRTRAGGAFSFPRMAPGSYLLDAFVDRDSTGVFAPGRPFPFSPSARFAIGTDTVRVRARWENANIKLRMPPAVPAD